MADPSTWPSASKSLIAVAPSTRQAGQATLPGAPHLERFANLQAGALREAIRKGREQAERTSATLVRQYDTPRGLVTTVTPGLGLNRQYRSVIEARMKWWQDRAIDAQIATYEHASESVRRAATARIDGYSASTKHAARLHVAPAWGEIRKSLRMLHSRMAQSLYAAFDLHLGTQALDALAAWPSKTGLSRALLSVQVAPGTSDASLMRGSLVAGAGYSGYIKAGGFRVKREEYTTKKGETKMRTKHVYQEGRLPYWKARYLVKDKDGRWRFDADRYEADAAGGAVVRDPDYKPARGKPYHDLLVKPTRATADAIGRAAAAGAVKEG